MHTVFSRAKASLFPYRYQFLILIVGILYGLLLMEMSAKVD